MIFPFLENATHQDGGLIGKTFVPYRNQHWSNTYEQLPEITFMEDGKTAEGWKWLVTDGILEITADDGSVVQRYNGVELVNGAVVAVGVDISSVPMCRVVLGEKVNLGDTNWQIFVSSAPRHSLEVTNKLVKSLKWAKVDLDKVTLVSGGIPAEESFSVQTCAVRHISTDSNMGGDTALGASSADDYRILLHGTCTVAEDFMARMEGINVGLKPDIILFAKEWPFGVYSNRFLSEQEDMNALDNAARLSRIRSRAKVVVILGSRTTTGAASNAYGDGVLRTEMKLPKVGITKFKSVAKR